jgi:hypothetical protein
MISSVSNAHASNAQQATQHSTAKALPEAPAKQQKAALPDDTVTLSSAGQAGKSPQSSG